MEKKTPPTPKTGWLSKDYQIFPDKRIKELGSEIVPAIQAQGPLEDGDIYALLVPPHFPLHVEMVEFLAEKHSPHLPMALSFGRTHALEKEHYAVILKKPAGKRISEWFKDKGFLQSRGALPLLVPQIAEALELLNKKGLIHGCLNYNTVFFDDTSGQASLEEPLSAICGQHQTDIFEPIERATVHPSGKGDMELSSDYYALGILILSCLIEQPPYEALPPSMVHQMRLENGSYEVALDMLRHAGNFSNLSKRMQDLLKGVLTDHVGERWQHRELRRWLDKEEIAPPISRLHRQATNSFHFDGKDYISRKALAHDIYTKWDVSKRSVKVSELARWLNLSIQHPIAAKAMARLSPMGRDEIVLPDEKLARILCILDPEGPIRYKNIAVHIQGIGPFLAHAYHLKEENTLHLLTQIIATGLVESWIASQAHPEDYEAKMLGWSPFRTRQLIKNTSLGFGLERALYDLNYNFPCQSPLMQGARITSLSQMLKTLDGYSGNMEENDPVDLHVAAYIGHTLQMTDEARVKRIQRYTYLAKNPQLHMLTLLTMAQTHAQIKSLPGLSQWLYTRLSTLVNNLHSRIIKQELKSRLKKALKAGNLTALFKVATASGYMKRDDFGFKEACKQYHRLSYEIAQMNKASNIQRASYHLGLRISVVLAYLVCTITLLYVSVFNVV